MTTTNTTLKLQEKNGRYRLASDDEIVQVAQSVLNTQLEQRDVLSSPKAVRDYLACLYRGVEHEVFYGLFLDSQNRLIRAELLATGTIDSAAIYPREVAKAALRCNAASALFTHQHPSGLSDPSQSDHRITERLKDALALLDIRVLDHVVFGSYNNYTSFAENGWM